MGRDMESLVFDDLTKEQQTAIIDWINEYFKPIKIINYKYSSYGLKQKFSRLMFYVTNKQFEAAMYKAGFFSKIKPETDAHCFNISEKSKYFDL